MFHLHYYGCFSLEFAPSHTGFAVPMLADSPLFGFARQFRRVQDPKSKRQFLSRTVANQWRVTARNQDVEYRFAVLLL
jgi:hypothetical protein